MAAIEITVDEANVLLDALGDMSESDIANNVGSYASADEDLALGTTTGYRALMASARAKLEAIVEAA